jgi:16S rRNA processing protein RimM
MTLGFVPSELPADAVEMGRILDAWGIKGWMKVHPHSSNPAALLAATTWFLQTPTPPFDRAFKAFTGTVCLDVTEIKPHADTLVALCPGVADRNQAEALKGARIFVSRSQFPASADPDEFYWVDLLGLSVVNREGVALGTVRDLMATGPHSVLVLEYQADNQPGDKPAERMIPFVSAYVDKVDKAAGLITVDWQPDY